jgi:uncharacterized membrane protein YgcG
MGESRVMTQLKEATEDELLFERLEIFDTEQTGGGSESDGGSSGEGSGGDDGGDGDEIIWHESPKE